jgi:hypothetical protein
MAHIGWFFAGTSCGLFVGVLLTTLAKISDLVREQDKLQPEELISDRRLRLVRR